MTETKTGQTPEAGAAEETITVASTEETQTPEPVTADTLKESGMSPEEIKMAADVGIIPKDAAKAPAEPKKAAPAPAKATEPKTPEPKTPQEIRELADKELTGEQERELHKDWNANEKAMYWERKKERTKRQTAEKERNYEKMLRLQAEKERDALKAMVDAGKKKPAEKPKPATEEGDPDDIDALLGTEDKPDQDKPAENPDDDRPITMKEAREILRKEREADEQRRKDLLQKQELVNSKLNGFEVEARAQHEDLDASITMAQELFKAMDNGTLTTLIPDAAKAQEVAKKCKEWVVASSKILDSDVPNLSELAYQIGTMHPKYTPAGTGTEEAPAEETPKKDEKKLTEEQLAKLQNPPKRKTSASLGGSGNTVPISQITLEQASKLTQAEFNRLPKEVVERLLKT